MMMCMIDDSCLLIGNCIFNKIIIVPCRIMRPPVDADAPSSAAVAAVTKKDYHGISQSSAYPTLSPASLSSGPSSSAVLTYNE